VADLTVERARECFHYNPVTGLVVWKIRLANKVRPGDRAGTPDGRQGRFFVGVDGKHYLLHRVIWLLVYGSFPANTVDHIDGDPSNNKLTNLRAATSSEQMKNLKRCRRNKSGCCGVSWDKVKGRWVSQISSGGRAYNLGRYKEYFDAVCARKAAEYKHGFHRNHGRI